MLSLNAALNTKLTAEVDPTEGYDETPLFTASK